MADQHSPLNLATVNRLAEIATAAQAGAVMAWVDDDDRVHEGIVRTIGPYDGYTQTEAADVRDQHVHITRTKGTGELWLPMGAVLDMRARGAAAFRSR